MQYKLYTPLAIHETGNRPNQEDSLWPHQATVDDRLFVVCDGMGGHEHGEVASQTVCQALGQWFSNHAKAGEPFNDEQLQTALEYAYTQLDQYADGSPKQMGTTLTLLYMHRQGVTAAHIGDSRIYHIRPTEGLLYQSRDHSLVFDLFQAGEITFEQMGSFAQKNIITRAMTPGEDKRMRPDIIHITDVQPGDWFYLCSDGMLEQMSSEELAVLLSAEGSDEKKRQQLIAATVDNQDNHTAWMIHVESVTREPGDEQLENEEPTARCNVLNMIRTQRMQADVQVTEDTEDVVIISAPPQQPTLPMQPMAQPVSMPKSHSSNRVKILIILVILLCLLILGGIFFLRSMKSPIVKFNKPKTEVKHRKARQKPTTGIEQHKTPNKGQRMIL